jgi:hypothetical protein
MASKRRLQDKDIAQELIFDSDFDAHTYEDGILPPQSKSDKEEDDKTE